MEREQEKEKLMWKKDAERHCCCRLRKWENNNCFLTGLKQISLNSNIKTEFHSATKNIKVNEIKKLEDALGKKYDVFNENVKNNENIIKVGKTKIQMEKYEEKERLIRQKDSERQRRCRLRKKENNNCFLLGSKQISLNSNINTESHSSTKNIEVNEIKKFEDALEKNLTFEMKTWKTKKRSFN